MLEVDGGVGGAGRGDDTAESVNSIGQRNVVDLL